MGDRKAYQKAYYQANKKKLNARKAAARRTKQAANGSAKLNAPKLTGAKAAKAISDWSARNLVVPHPPPPTRGTLPLADWQSSWLQDAFAPGVKEAALSIAGRNGKSFLIGVVLLAHLCGPLTRANWRAAVVSLTGKLASELREAVRQIAEASGLGYGRLPHTRG